MEKFIKLIKNTLFKLKLFQLASISYCLNKEVLPKIIVNTPSEILRRTLGLPFSVYNSQLNQDFFALLFNKFKKGYFIEIGANDGFNLSNTNYLEECFGWNGILIEANPVYLPSLKSRKAFLCNKAVAESEGIVEFIDLGLFGGISSKIDKKYREHICNANKIKVPATTLKQILQEYSAPSVIDYISIDVEGGDLTIVEQMCELKEYRFVCGSIEHNYRKEQLTRFTELLKSANYEIVWSGQTSHDIFFIDGLRNLQ